MNNHREGRRPGRRFIIRGALIGSAVGVAVTFMPAAANLLIPQPRDDLFMLTLDGAALYTALLLSHVVGLKWNMEKNSAELFFAALVLNSALLGALGGVLGCILSRLKPVGQEPQI